MNFVDIVIVTISISFPSLNGANKSDLVDVAISGNTIHHSRFAFP